MTEQLRNYLMLAETAKNGGNNEEAISYYNKILEIDASVNEAWAGKGIAILNSSKIGDIKSSEAVAYFLNALKNNPKIDTKNEIYDHLLSFSGSSYVGIAKHYNQYKTTKNASNDHSDRFNQILSLLDLAEAVFPGNRRLFDRGIELTSSFLKHNVDGHSRKDVTNKFNYYAAKLKEIDPNYKAPSPGCFIATAAVGNYNHPDVLQLRRFRDSFLATKCWGKRFIQYYYIYSPFYADKLKQRRVLAKVIHLMIIKPISFFSRLFT